MYYLIQAFIVMLKSLSSDKPDLTKKVNTMVSDLILVQKKEWHKLTPLFMLHLSPLQESGLKTYEMLDVILNAAEQFFYLTDNEIWLLDSLKLNNHGIVEISHKLENAVKNGQEV